MYKKNLIFGVICALIGILGISTFSFYLGTTALPKEDDSWIKILKHTEYVSDGKTSGVIVFDFVFQDNSFRETTYRDPNHPESEYEYSVLDYSIPRVIDKEGSFDSPRMLARSIEEYFDSVRPRPDEYFFFPGDYIRFSVHYGSEYKIDMPLKLQFVARFGENIVGVEPYEVIILEYDFPKSQHFIKVEL